jgi:hypothetical protein
VDTARGVIPGAFRSKSAVPFMLAIGIPPMNNFTAEDPKGAEVRRGKPRQALDFYYSSASFGSSAMKLSRGLGRCYAPYFMNKLKNTAMMIRSYVQQR